MIGRGEKKGPPSQEELAEFLQLLKRSEYSVVEQLHRAPAKISILSLILHSEAHRNALLKVLNESYVPDSVPINSFQRLVGHIQEVNFITFTDEELNDAGRGHIKALHISVECKGCHISKVLIDNGSALNVLPKKTLDQLPVDQTAIMPSSTMVRAFDGSVRGVLGTIELPIVIGPITFSVGFQVMDVDASYCMLLGRPWLHIAGAVPSSLHQKVKFVHDGKMIEVKGEEEVLIARLATSVAIEDSDQPTNTTFQSFELVHATWIAEGKEFMTPKVSKKVMAAARMIYHQDWMKGSQLQKVISSFSELFEMPVKND